MTISTIRDLLSLHEGRAPYAYKDSLGYLTIGVGHMVDKALNGRLPEPIIDALLDYDISEYTKALETALPWSAGLAGPRKAALVDMCFNLGISKLLGFRNTLSFIEHGQYDQAADAMLHSTWASQVGQRAKRLAQMIRSGAWPES